jgi:hypothetical protein
MVDRIDADEAARRDEATTISPAPEKRPGCRGAADNRHGGGDGEHDKLSVLDHDIALSIV